MDIRVKRLCILGPCLKHGILRVSVTFYSRLKFPRLQVPMMKLLGHGLWDRVSDWFCYTMVKLFLFVS